MTSHNLEVFDKIRLRLTENIKGCSQPVADAARDYFVEQFEAASSEFGGSGQNDFGTWAPSVSGDPISLYKTGNLYEKLKDCNQNWTRTANGIKISLEVESENGFDYGSYQNSEGGRPFFEVSDQLNQKIKRVYENHFKNNLNP